VLRNKIKNKIKTTTIDRYPSLFRPSSDPYLSGDSLRKISDFVFDESASLNPEKVQKNSIVFLKTDLLDIFFTFYHPFINEEYILITHNSDRSIGETDLKYLDNKIIHWFATKLNTKSTDRITGLCYGLENRRYLKNGRIGLYKKIIKNKKNNQKHERVLCSFNPSTNPTQREPLLEIAKSKKNLIDIKNFSKSNDYLQTLSTYLFNLCPEGNDFESHRIWESLLFNCTPIVEKNNVNDNFYNMGVPLIMLDKWSDLESLKIEDLKLLNKINKDKNYEQFSTLNFWIEKINHAKK
tara:strand:- start:172 stop:1056 length:885 start_codon:yes stop_codon:yes gene_type:complete